MSNLNHVPRPSSWQQVKDAATVIAAVALVSIVVLGLTIGLHLELQKKDCQLPPQFYMLSGFCGTGESNAVQSQPK